MTDQRAISRNHQLTKAYPKMAKSASPIHSETIFWSILFIIAAIWPLFVFTYPSAQDIPNHLARAFILLNPDDPALNQHFTINWRPIPNLAWDSFAVIFGQFLSLAWTLKLFMLLSLSLTIIGVTLLNRAIVGQWTWAPLIAFPFLFNTGYAKGFLSFNLGVGIALIACAWWVAIEEKRWVLRLVIATLLSTLLFYTHLVAWGIYGIFMLGIKISELIPSWAGTGGSKKPFGLWFKNLLRDGIQALPPLILAAAVSASTQEGSNLSGKIADFHNPFRRFIEIWRLIDTGAWWPSIAFLIVCGVTALALLFLRKAKLSARFYLPIALLLTLYFCLPNQIYNTHYVVWRLALGATFVAIAGSIPLFAINTKLARSILTLFIAATLGLSSWQALSTYNVDIEHQAFSKLIQRVPEGNTLFMSHARLDLGEMASDRLGLYHLAGFAVIERKLMPSNLFANPAQQPIGYKNPAFNQITATGKVFRQDWDSALAKLGKSFSGYISQFEWLVLHGKDAEFDRDHFPLHNFLLAGEQGNFRLYCKVHKNVDPVSGQKINVCPDQSTP